MNVRIKTTDGEIHVFKATDAIEPLRHYTFDRELHTFRLQTSDKSEIEYGFPLENVVWIKMNKEEM